MNIHKTSIAIERATSLVTLLVGRDDDTEGKYIDDTLFDINRNLCDAAKYLNEPVEMQVQPETERDIKDILCNARGVINQLRAVATVWDRTFGEKDIDTEEQALCWLTLNLSTEALELIRKAENLT
ncbi:TPA: hypothetical protein ACJG4C_003896 [Salmonella enterica subsp. diarizonae serovar 61:r:z53]